MENATRKRPGPKPVGGELVRRYSISIRPSQAARLVALGEGNLSSGVRRSLAYLERTFDNDH